MDRPPTLYHGALELKVEGSILTPTLINTKKVLFRQ